MFIRYEDTLINLNIVDEIFKSFLAINGLKRTKDGYFKSIFNLEFGSYEECEAEFERLSQLLTGEKK